MPTALVTGPTSGIGLAFARALAARGHDLVLVSRDRTRLEQVADELASAHGVAAEVLAADLAEPDDRAVVERRLADAARPVDVLVNNAGFGIRSPFAGSTALDEQQLLDVLVTSVLRLTHAAVPGMVARGSGTIVNVSSIAGWIAGGTYSAAKAWVTVFSEGLHAELAGSGVTVTAACPGFVRTEFHQRAGMRMRGIPSWMWLDPDAVVDRALRDAAAGRPLSVTGLQYRAFGVVLRHGPRVLARRVGGSRARTRAKAGPDEGRRQ